jgi:hypothetical protein
LFSTPSLMKGENQHFYGELYRRVEEVVHRSQNSVDYHIDRGRLRGLFVNPSRALMAYNESGPRT